MTATEPRTTGTTPTGNLVDMAWDPITRIVGSLGIYTKIDFDAREVVECQHCVGHAQRSARRGSRMSRRPSPNRLKASTV